MQLIDEGSISSSSGNAWLYLEEIVHRALNDYSAMLSVLQCASLAVSDEESKRALNTVARRLRAGANVFHALKPPADAGLRDLNRELELLCSSLSISTLSWRGIRLTLSADSVMLEARRCWQLSLIISELVTNAARHAFREKSEGSIVITLRADGDSFECTVVDNGACSSTQLAPGSGTAIVNALIHELHGTISREYTGAGSTIAFRVPIAEAAKPFFGHDHKH